MRQYIIRRILTSILVLFGVSILLYGMLRMMPGDFVSQMTSGNPSITVEQQEKLRESYGLNGTIIEGYFRWVKDALRGDFGISFTFQKPVIEVIKSRMWTSFALSFSAFIIELLIAIPFGIIAATKQYTKTDYIIVFFALAGISLPTFFFAAVLQRTFAMGLKWLPLSGIRWPPWNGDSERKLYRISSDAGYRIPFYSANNRIRHLWCRQLVKICQNKYVRSIKCGLCSYRQSKRIE